MKAPALLTPADWHAYLVRLALEAWDRTSAETIEQECGSRYRDQARVRFVYELRERMAQASMVVTCEIDLARGGGR